MKTSSKSVPDMIWEQLSLEIKAIKEDVESIRVRTERSETTSGHPSSTFVAAPLAAGGAKQGDELWITDGNKNEEVGANGSGVMAYFNPDTNSWLRISDNGAPNAPSGKIPSSTLANAPLAAQGAIDVMLWFITNGRKSGELAGAGTGVVAFYQPSTDEWRAVYNGLPVLI